MSSIQLMKKEHTFLRNALDSFVSYRRCRNENTSDDLVPKMGNKDITTSRILPPSNVRYS